MMNALNLFALLAIRLGSTPRHIDLILELIQECSPKLKRRCGGLKDFFIMIAYSASVSCIAPFEFDDEFAIQDLGCTGLESVGGRYINRHEI